MIVPAQFIRELDRLRARLAEVEARLLQAVSRALKAEVRAEAAEARLAEVEAELSEAIRQGDDAYRRLAKIDRERDRRTEWDEHDGASSAAIHGGEDDS